MNNFLDPYVRAKLIEDKVLKPLTKHQRMTAQAIAGQLIENTPVDTSRAKSNWWTDVNIINTTIREPDQGAAATAQALSVSKQDIKLEDVIYITNNLPYIKRLNDGWSGQQPTPGWVEGAIQVGNDRGKEAAKRIK